MSYLEQFAAQFPEAASFTTVHDKRDTLRIVRMNTRGIAQSEVLEMAAHPKRANGAKFQGYTSAQLLKIARGAK